MSNRFDPEFNGDQYEVTVIDAERGVREDYLVSASSEDRALDNWRDPRYSMLQASMSSQARRSDVIARPA